MSGERIFDPIHELLRNEHATFSNILFPIAQLAARCKLRLYEFEAKKIMKHFGISIPESIIPKNTQELASAYSQLGPSIALKSQVPVNRRMDAGGIRFADSVEQASSTFTDMLNTEISGFKAYGILVEEKLPFDQEYYLGITYDQSAQQPVIIFSTSGGTAIEKNASKSVNMIHWDLSNRFPMFKCRELLSPFNIGGKDLLKMADLVYQLAQLFTAMDATLVEVNPLVKTDQNFCALDAHIELDDDALYRNKILTEKNILVPDLPRSKQNSEFEAQAARIDQQDHRGVAGRVIEFDGDLGLLIGGGGASLTAFDALRRYGGKPANYCEIGGNPSVRKITQLTKLLLAQPRIKKIAVIMNVVSNTRVDLVARGVIMGIVESGYDPAEKIAVFRIPGAWEEEGYKILKKYNVPFCDRRTSIDQAAKIAVAAN